MKKVTLIIICLLATICVFVQKEKKTVLKAIETKKDKYKSIALQIWNWAEVGYQEVKSSGLLKEALQML